LVIIRYMNRTIPSAMPGTVEMIRIVLQLGFGIAAILWYPYEIVYRFYHSRKDKIGFWEVDTPLWHKIAIWPIILGMFILFSWTLFFD